jgi:hypothetical protein
MASDEIVAASVDDLYDEDIYNSFDWEDGDYEVVEYEGGADYGE